jgi:hypothetical protein
MDDDEELEELVEVERGHAASDVEEEREAADLFLWIPDLESATGFVAYKVRRAPAPSSRSIGFRRDAERR